MWYPFQNLNQDEESMQNRKFDATKITVDGKPLPADTSIEEVKKLIQNGGEKNPAGWDELWAKLRQPGLSQEERQATQHAISALLSGGSTQTVFRGLNDRQPARIQHEVRTQRVELEPQPQHPPFDLKSLVQVRQENYSVFTEGPGTVSYPGSRIPADLASTIRQKESGEVGKNVLVELEKSLQTKDLPQCVINCIYREIEAVKAHPVKHNLNTRDVPNYLLTLQVLLKAKDKKTVGILEDHLQGHRQAIYEDQLMQCIRKEIETAVDSRRDEQKTPAP